MSSTAKERKMNEKKEKKKKTKAKKTDPLKKNSINTCLYSRSFSLILRYLQHVCCLVIFPTFSFKLLDDIKKHNISSVHCFN